MISGGRRRRREALESLYIAIEVLINEHRAHVLTRNVGGRGEAVSGGM